MSIGALGLLLMAASPAQLDLPREFRAVWVATVDNIDWPSKRGLPAKLAREELRAIIDTSARAGLNAVVFQVRPSGDALYESRLEPWSEYLTGEQGRPPDDEWDPLAFAVEECHQRGMELHAWFNPYRARHPSAKTPDVAPHLSLRKPEVVKSYGRYRWMDPSEKTVQDHSYAVMMDAVRRYDLDGVHIDDYFYPYKEKGSDGKDLDFPDQASRKAYVARTQKSGSVLSLGDWRRKSVDDFIERLYRGIKKEKRWVKFGISPFGIYRPGVPSGIQAGVDQFADLYADARKWLVEGWCDYYAPQLYWPIKQTAQSFPKLLDWWTSPDQNPIGRHVWPGLFTGQVFPEQKNWQVQEVLDQIGLIRKASDTGHIHFSAKSLMRNPKGLRNQIRGLYGGPALIPPSAWLGDEPPARPKIEGRTGSQVVLSVDPQVRFYAARVQGRGWQVSSNPAISVPDGASATIYAISRTGIPSAALTVGPDRG